MELKEHIDFIEVYPTNFDCNPLIEHFHNHEDECDDGVIFSSSGKEVNKDIKNTKDLTFAVSSLKIDNYLGNLFRPTFNCLSQALSLYCDKYKIDKQVTVSNLFNLQYYTKGQHFKQFHYEHSYKHHRRILVWMIYLNDVPEGGRTLFPYQNYEISPIAGNILIWPANFTHLHAGDVVGDHDKYILTGWFEYTSATSLPDIKELDSKKSTYFNIETL